MSTKVQALLKDEELNGNLANTLRTYFSILFCRRERKLMIWLVIIPVFLGIIPSIDSILLGMVTNQIKASTSLNSDITASSLFIWAIIYAVWWEGLNIIWRIFDYVYLLAMPKLKARFVDDMFNTILNHRIEFFSERLSGEISSRIANGATAVEMIYLYLFEKIVRKFAVMVFALVTLYSVNPLMGNIFLVWMIIFISTSLLFAKRLNQFSIKCNHKRAIVSGRIVDSITNIPVIRLFTARRYERRYLKHYLQGEIDASKDMQLFALKLRYFLGMMTSLLIFFMIYFLIRLASNDVISVGDCVLIITLCISVVDEVWELTQEFCDMFEEVGSFQHALALKNYDQVKEDHDSKELVIKEASIEYRNVTFNYKHNDSIFSNKNVYIPTGQRVGLVGFSGSGKTTFTKLITRINDVEDGEILISGTNIQKVTQDSLRKQITVIPQEPILFNRSIFENILYSNQEKSDDEVIEAAKAAHIHDVIMRFPDGYNTNVGERGNRLSIGQRQRVMIARAFLRNTPILIIDEATSALDTRTETLIQDSLQHLMEGKTVLVIAHRLPTLLDMDRILVFEHGNIVEEGTHDELKNNGKLYQLLWESQSKGYI